MKKWQKSFALPKIWLLNEQLEPNFKPINGKSPNNSFLPTAQVPQVCNENLRLDCMLNKI